MRKYKVSIATLLVVAWLLMSAVASSLADETLEGRYKLSLLVYGQDEFLVLDFKPEASDLQIDVVDAQKFLGPSPKATDIAWQDGQLEFTIDTPAMKSNFAGNLITEGDQAGQILGTYNFRDTDYPARLERTEAEKVAELTRSPLTVELATARREDDAQAKVEKLKELLEKYSGPSLHLVYTELLRAASDAEFTSDEVADYVKAWLDNAALYGDRWLTQSRAKALAALDGQKAYADLSVKLAKEADSATTDETPTDQQAAIVAALARAAELAGDEQLAAEAIARSEKLETQLDEEYLASVPPFEPAPFEGRASSEHDRALLLELFTGAQCPPCVAADVAFDAVLESYQPSEVVALQYHLHIPGPDPLTSEASNKRQAYYGVRGTPSTYFNGEDLAGGGGGMSGAEGKYAMYRSIINDRLNEAANAKIDLQVTRSGEKLIINVSAQVDEAALEAEPAADDAPAEEDAAEEEEKSNPEDGQEADDGDEAEDKAPQLRLRLALTEESIRYVGGNDLRFHHHVVREMPGGVEGKELVAGQAQEELTIDLAELRASQEKYLADYAETRSFPNPLPAIDLANLSVVAFVQNDATKEVLQAVSVAVEGD